MFIAVFPIAKMANRWGSNGNSDRLYFGGLQITADGDRSHEIKRHLLLGRKAMTNLGSTLKRIFPYHYVLFITINFSL